MTSRFPSQFIRHGSAACSFRMSPEAAGLLMGDLARVEQHKTSAGATAAVIVGVPLVFLAIGLARWER